jgi:hypothetical protein
MPGRNFHNGFRRETVDIDDPEVRAFIEHCRAGDVSNEEASGVAVSARSERRLGAGAVWGNESHPAGRGRMAFAWGCGCSC